VRVEMTTRHDDLESQRQSSTSIRRFVEFININCDREASSWGIGSQARSPV
jgi:hypothetical protein